MNGIEPGRRIVVVMGASGSGKTTIGTRIAGLLGCPFIEADALHSPANVSKMRAGIALDDADRRPWLDVVGKAAGDVLRCNGSVVVACSALKRAYRDRIRDAAGFPVTYVVLIAPADELSRRVAARSDHFMPAILVGSQVAILELPEADETARTFAAGRPIDVLVREAVEWLCHLSAVE